MTLNNFSTTKPILTRFVSLCLVLCLTVSCETVSHRTPPKWLQSVGRASKEAFGEPVTYRKAVSFATAVILAQAEFGFVPTLAIALGFGVIDNLFPNFLANAASRVIDRHAVKNE